VCEGECKRQVDSVLRVIPAELSNGSCHALDSGGGDGSETAVRSASKTIYAEREDTIFIL
jgi:hypothetical protein